MKIIIFQEPSSSKKSRKKKDKAKFKLFTAVKDENLVG